MEAPWRVLVDWDYEAGGLWGVAPPEQTRATREEWAAGTAEGGRWWRPNPRQKLSADLLGEVKRWNDECDDASLAACPEQRTQTFDGLLARARLLAVRVQEQLGPEWEVLYASRGAWHWVARPNGWA
jgi:hypothetical protein